jgi:MFS family permease
MKGMLTSSLELGAFFGSLTCSPLADRYSRKHTILLGCIIFFIGGFLQAIARSLWMLFMGRAVGGWGVGMLSCLAPLYMSEIAPKEIRGSLLALEQFSIVSGVVMGFWYVFLCFDLHRIDYGTRNIDSELSFRLPLFLQLIPALLLGIGTTILPYSPRWLASQSRDSETLAVLSKLRQRPQTDAIVQQEWREIKVEVALMKDTTTTWKEMFIGRIRKRTFIGIGIMFFQQFSGINALLYYAYSNFRWS